MEKQEESKTYTLSEKQFGEVVLQVGILKETYSQVKEHKGMNIFQKKILLKNKASNESILKELEEIHNKSQ